MDVNKSQRVPLLQFDSCGIQIDSNCMGLYYPTEIACDKHGSNFWIHHDFPKIVFFPKFLEGDFSGGKCFSGRR